MDSWFVDGSRPCPDEFLVDRDGNFMKELKTQLQSIKKGLVFITKYIQNIKHISQSSSLHTSWTQVSKGVGISLFIRASLTDSNPGPKFIMK